MPNWCNNKVSITCPSKEIYDKLLVSLENNNWFATFVPIGSGHESNYSYEEVTAAWSTKWDATEIYITSQDEEFFFVEFTFETVWNPPYNVYKIMNEKFNIDISAFYYESGCRFFGRNILNKNNYIDQRYCFPENNAELIDIRRTINNDLDDYMSPIWDLLIEDFSQ
jgi:hypothetical protein